eukprot:COSAG01_NODE_19013_length_1036_cov_19.017076_1_plen_57_part_10
MEAEKAAGNFPGPQPGDDDSSSSDEDESDDDFDEEFASINDLFKTQKLSKPLRAGGG